LSLYKQIFIQIGFIRLAPTADIFALRVNNTQST
jgi:hypothetical protein